MIEFITNEFTIYYIILSLLSFITLCRIIYNEYEQVTVGDMITCVFLASAGPISALAACLVLLARMNWTDIVIFTSRPKPITKLERDVTQLEKSINGLWEQLTISGSTVTQLEKSINGLWEQLTISGSTVTEIKVRLDKIEKKLNKRKNV